MIVYDKLWQTMKNKGITQYALYEMYALSHMEVMHLYVLW